MGYSFAYILFIGLAEVVGAWLLLWERTKLLGVAILLPIMFNILIFDFIFLDKYGALASATIYTLLLFVILAAIVNEQWQHSGRYCPSTARSRGRGQQPERH